MRLWTAPAANMVANNAPSCYVDRMKHLLALTLAAMCACCAHTHTPMQPPTSGYFGVIHPGKPVQCIMSNETETGEGAGLTASQCQVLAEQIQIINKAVGFELLHYAGPVYPRTANDLAGKCEDFIYVGAGSLPGNTIGLTVPRCMQGPYIMGEVILLDPFIWDSEAMHGAQPADVVLHELLHAVGLGHADKDGAFASIMEPHIQRDVHGLQPSDLVTLRTVYK